MVRHAFLVGEEKVVVRHHVAQDVIPHEHVQRVVGVGIVGSGAHFDAIVAEVVVPAGFWLGAVGIDLVGEGCEVVDVVDTVGFQHLVGLGEDGESEFARSQFIFQCRSSCRVDSLVFRLVTFVLLGQDDVLALEVGKRVGKRRSNECLVEDGEFLVLAKFTCDEVVRAGEHVVDFVEHAVFEFVVHQGDDGVLVEHESA